MIHSSRLHIYYYSQAHKIPLLKNFSVDYKKGLGQLIFPTYEGFDVSAAYSDLFRKIISY